jgi:pimeloyl-ACP methyl ester carboxylesterase
MVKEFLYKGLAIPYTETGNGATVVLLHGFAETGDVWEEQISFLQNHYRVIVPEIPAATSKEQSIATDLTALTSPLYDLPFAIAPTATSSSFEIALPLSSSIEEMADATAAFIKSVSDNPVFLLGHSMGGYITLAMAQKYPGLLKAFGLIHSTAFADTEEKKETRRKSIDFIRKNDAEAFFKTSAPGLFSEQSKKEMPERIQENISMATEYASEILIANYEAMMARPDYTSVLSGSKVPVLFIIGKEDKAAPAADVLKQVHLPQVSYFHLLDNVAHMGMWEATEQVNHLILNFIQDCG